MAPVLQLDPRVDEQGNWLGTPLFPCVHLYGHRVICEFYWLIAASQRDDSRAAFI